MHPTLESAREAVSERLSPALDTLEQNVRDARRAVARGRRAAEDCLDETTLRVRRHPWSSMALGLGAGALAGCLFGLALGWQAGHHRSSR
jgi:ElaB/YqjD/DUF883 family membrane-anchored ribosome-binding protein